MGSRTVYAERLGKLCAKYGFLIGTSGDRLASRPLRMIVYEADDRRPAKENERTVLFMCWARRGALPHLAAELSACIEAQQPSRALLTVSLQNESMPRFKGIGEHVFPVNTFSTNLGAIAQAWRIMSLRRWLVSTVRSRNISAIVDLMPHVWSPFVVGAAQSQGVAYMPIIHDAVAHPGDSTALVKGILDLAIKKADQLITLSGSVRDQLSANRWAAQKPIEVLFHPSLSYGEQRDRQPPTLGQPIRLLFLGRILPYKGLPLFVDTIDLLRSNGVAVEAGVFGEGDLGRSAEHLQRLGAEVVNRWLSEAEIAAVLARYHAVILSHVEASQSGVAAAAAGAGLPVIATPVGGLVEQVAAGIGVLASEVSAQALANAVMRLRAEPQTYRAIVNAIAVKNERHSMQQFLIECLRIADKNRPI